MKKILILALMLFMLFALAACGGNGNNDTLELPPPTIQNETVSAEELKIQIDVASSELLSTFSNLHRADVRTPGDGEGIALVIWANQALHNFSVTALASDLLEDSDEWGFMPVFGFGSVSVLWPGEAFVIENYTGAGTLPHRGISFTDAGGTNTRVFSFQENHAYPEHGGQWVIGEIEADRITWDFYYAVVLPNEIVINGAGFIDNAYGNASPVYFAAGQLPTHITLSVLWALGIDVMAAGSQMVLQYGGVPIVELNVINYLTFGADRVAVGIYDTFMADDGYFTVYIPISLLDALGFDVYFERNHVHIDGQFNVAMIGGNANAPSTPIFTEEIIAAERDAEANAASHFIVRVISETLVDTGFGMNDDFGGCILVFELENISGRAVTVDISTVFRMEHGEAASLIDQNIHFEPGQARQFTYSFGEYIFRYSSYFLIEYMNVRY